MSDERSDIDDPNAGRPRPTATPAQRPRVLTPSVQLENDQRHPVLVFGSSLSGKSTMIMSFINALEKAGKEGGATVNVTFGRSFYRQSDIKSAQQQRYAQNFYETAAYNFITARTAIDTTQVDIPYFVPLDLAVRGDNSEPVCIAILDGRGEWYEPDVNPTSASLYQELREDIQEVLKNYQRGISVIWVAPLSLSDDRQHDTHDSDAGLAGAMEHYQALRSKDAIHNDSHLMLLTKWDQFASPANDSRFSRLNGAEVVREFSERYQRAWNRFRSLPIGPNDAYRRHFMQYSACRFVEHIPQIPPDHEDQYLRYPRTVVNWMYGNARRYQIENGSWSVVGSRNLFDDVVDPGVRQISLSERILKWVTR